MVFDKARVPFFDVPDLEGFEVKNISFFRGGKKKLT
jgi:hypothetical protein